MNKRPDFLNMEKQSSMDSVALNRDTAAVGHFDADLIQVDGQKVLRNTYMLLALTLLFSAGVAMLSMMFHWPHPGLLMTLVGYFGLLFFVEKTKNSAMGLVAVFALTGFMGLTLGPIVSMYAKLPNGSQLITMALGTTGLIFVSMSAWVLATGKELSGWGKSLTVGILLAFVLGLGAVFFEMPALSLAVSGMFVILMSGLIAYQTSAIIHGGESNYISATVTLFVSIYNLFLSLLQIFGVLSDD